MELRAAGPRARPGAHLPAGTRRTRPTLISVSSSALASYLGQQRWFGGKARRVDDVRLVDWTALGRGGAPPFLALAEVTYGDGGREHYVLPLAAVRDRDGSAGRPGTAPRPTLAAEGLVLTDGVHDDETCHALLALIEDELEIRTATGELRGWRAAGRPKPAGPLDVRRSGAEQSNTSVMFGHALILKLFRRLQRGPNPEVEIGRFLTTRGRFTRMPPLEGAIEYRTPGHEPSDLAVLQGLVGNQGSGWDHALAEIGRYYSAIASVDLPPLAAGRGRIGEPPAAVRTAAAASLEAAATLGRQTAELHLALAEPSNDPAFDPEPLTGDALRVEADAMTTQAGQVFALLRGAIDRLPDALRARASALLAREPEIVRSLGEVAALAGGLAATRCHGDYHLGQVLWTGRDYFIIDFEGEPTRSIAERRRKRSPVYDVAGMMRSYGYAAWSGLFAAPGESPAAQERLANAAAHWEQWNGSAFLSAYLDAAGRAPFLPDDPTRLGALLRVLTLDKAIYELGYELNNRLSWVRIPLDAVLGLAATAGDG